MFIILFLRQYTLILIMFLFETVDIDNVVFDYDIANVVIKHVATETIFLEIG